MWERKAANEILLSLNTVDMFYMYVWHVHNVEIAFGYLGMSGTDIFWNYCPIAIEYK